MTESQHQCGLQRFYGFIERIKNAAGTYVELADLRKMLKKVVGRSLENLPENNVFALEPDNTKADFAREPDNG